MKRPKDQRRRAKRDAKRALEKLKSSPSPSPSVSPSPLSAAEKVYGIIELRRRIITHLSRGSLSRFMRVERGCMKDVARTMFHHMGYVRLESRLSEPDERDDIYRSSVSEINALDMTLSDDLRKELGLAPDTPSDYLKSYHVEVMDIVVPALRKKFSGLRKIFFGCTPIAYGKPYWNISFIPARIYGSIDSPPLVQHFHHVEVDTSSPPLLSDIPGSAVSSESFPVKDRFDLTLTSTAGKPSVEETEGWCKAFRNNSAFGKIHLRIYLKTLAPSLDDLIALYEHQIALGYPADDRLKSFRAKFTQPPTFDQFHTFSSLATTSITRLRIACAYPSEGANISFTQLGDLVSVIKSMPNLNELTMSVADIELAEDMAATMLHSDILGESGSIKDLTPFTSPNSPPHFNLLRVLSSCLSNSANAIVSITHSDPLWGSAQLSGCLRYMRNQLPSRRTFLGTVDFNTLDIHTPEAILHLTYNEDHSPQRRGQTKAATWVEQTVQIRNKALSEIMPGIDTCTQGLIEAAAGIEEISGNATYHEMMERSLMLLDATMETRRRADEMGRTVKAMEDDVRNYIAGLAARLG